MRFRRSGLVVHRSLAHLVADPRVDDSVFQHGDLRDHHGAQTPRRSTVAHLDGRVLGISAQRHVLGARRRADTGAIKGPALKRLDLKRLGIKYRGAVALREATRPAFALVLFVLPLFAR